LCNRDVAAVIHAGKYVILKAVRFESANTRGGADVIDRIADGRTDLVFDYLATGQPATSKDKDGTSLVNWGAYYEDVNAIKFLLAQGETLQSLRLGETFGQVRHT
jgi:hypothetical protein